MVDENDHSQTSRDEGSAAISRRRMAFRPPPASSNMYQRPRPVESEQKPFQPQQEEHQQPPPFIPPPPIPTSSSCDDQIMMNSMEQTILPDIMDNLMDSENLELARKVKSWSHEEIMVFYEAVKQFGKDFESIAQYVERRKISREIDQIKNFYYNYTKYLKNAMQLDNNEAWNAVSKDGKELFLIINSCEWRKRTGNQKYPRDRLRELIFTGQTTVRSNKRSVTIKTPFCPALVKMFSINRRFDEQKFPSNVVLTINPKSNFENSYVISKEQNPLLKMKVSMNEKLFRVLRILQKKWGGIVERKTDKGKTALVKLFPAPRTEVGCVSFDAVPTESHVLSVNRLKKNMDDIAEKKKIDDSVAYSLVVPLDSHLVLNENTLRGGITEHNVRGATVCELFCLCGMTENITLEYVIERVPTKMETWNIVTSLLSREFGDAFDEDSKKRPFTDSVSDDNSNSNPPSAYTCDKCKTSEDENNVTFPPMTKAILQRAVPVPPVAASDVVLRENAAFMEQYKILADNKKQRTSTKRTRTHDPQTKTKSAPPVKKAPQSKTYYVRPEDFNSQPPDFAQQNKVYSQHHSRHDDYSNNILAGLGTPPRNNHVYGNGNHNDSFERRKVMMEDLFGGELSKSPTRSLYRSVDEVDQFFENSPCKRMTTGAAHHDSITGYVSTAMTDMMNQNSVDFCRTFEGLANHLERSPRR